MSEYINGAAGRDPAPLLSEAAAHQLFDTIDLIISSKIKEKNVSSIFTQTGVVKSRHYNEYQVEIDNSLFTSFAINGSVIYQEGDVVYLLCTKDSNIPYFILGCQNTQRNRITWIIM